MNNASLARRQKKATPFPQIAKAPEPEPEPKSNGAPMPHVFIIESIRVLKEYRFHCAECEAAHVSSVHPIGQGTLIKAVNPRDWPRYGWEVAP